ncbi:MAG TPA: hypothetical protein VFY29_13430 [Terriglobia bacterium]|nr:hypothetical protein [Terriglobia bacterium]
MLELATSIYDTLGIGSSDSVATSLAMGAVLYASLIWLLRWGYQLQGKVLANSQSAALANAIPAGPSEAAVSNDFSSVDEKGRTFVNVLPAELAALYKSNPTPQAEKLFESYQGKWIVTTFTVGDVEREEYGLGNSIMILSDQRIRRPLIAAMFDLKWRARLSRVQKGDPITIVGEISGGNATYIGLRHCEPSEQEF